MKVSVSLPDDDVALLDQLATERGTSRSALLHEAVVLLRSQRLGADYAAAWDEWDATDGPLWDAVVGDGIE